MQTILLAVVAACVLPAWAGAATYYVDGANPAANNSNPGTEALPYRTIQFALDARGGPGNTIYVKPAIYRETLTPPAGATDNPFVLQALGSGVILDGAEAYTNTAQWSGVAGSVFLAASVNWNPVQVFVNGERLTASTNAPSSLPPLSYRYVSGTGLYLNAGGPNPGTQQTFVGKRTYGIRLSGRPWVEVRGFTILRYEDRQIYLSSGSDFCVIAGNTISWGGKYGIGISNCNDVLVENNVTSDHLDHGIQLSQATECVIRRNESMRNARPASRAANGIHLNAATNNRVEANRLHHNQDTGLHFQGANDNLSLQNFSYLNGDHGYDHLSTSGVVHLGDIAYGNYKDGFSIEGKSPGNTVMNCIAVDNGLTTDEFDLWVDAASSVGFVSDYNMFWNSTGQQPIKYVTTKYLTIAAYSAESAHDSHSIQADPRFVDPANGNFHLLGGSPAIDAAVSSIAEWPATDADGLPRRDDPSTPNNGAGSSPFHDRGAFEFQTQSSPGDEAPVVVVTAGGTYPENSAIVLTVTASDPESQPITSLTADFSGLPAGHNATFTPGPGNTSGTFTWTPSFADARFLAYPVRFTAANSHASTASTYLTITNVDRSPVVNAPATKSGGEATVISVNLTASDPDGDAITALIADLSALPQNHGAVLSVNSSKTSATLTWTPTYADSGVYPIVFTATNSLTGKDTTLVSVIHVDRAPLIVAPATVTGAENTPLQFNVVAADPDSDAIAALTASGLPAGATFTPAPNHKSGVVSWLPTFDDAGGPYDITFTATNVLAGSGVTAVTITNVDRPPHVAAPDTVNAYEGVPASFSVTAGDLDGQTLISLAASNLPPGAVFTADAGNTHGTLSWTPGFDAAPGPYIMVFTATSTSSGSDSTVFRVSEANRPPVITAPANVVAVVGQTLTLPIIATDPDGDAIATLTANLGGLPAGNAAFVPNPTHTGGTLTWTPQPADFAGAPFTVTFTATNALSGTATTVIALDRPPVVSAPATVSATENAPVEFSVSATDPDGQAIVSLTAAGLPAGATFTLAPSGTSGTFAWTPGFAAAPGPYAVTFTASNGSSGTAVTSVAVANVDRAPQVTAPPLFGIADGVVVHVAVSVVDPDAEPISTLTADLTGLPHPNDAVFVPNGSNTGGVLTWTPNAGDGAGSPYLVTFTAANALSGTDSTSLVGDHGPTVSAPDSQGVAEGQLLEFTVTATDQEGDPITSLTASGLPPGATFVSNPAHTSGTFTWTPGSTAAPGPYTVIFTATNSTSRSANTLIHVSDVDRAPVVTAPATRSVAAGQLLSFSVAAADPDGEAIASLTASGLPPGATFTSNGAHTSGTLTWTPSAADAPGPHVITFTATNALTGASSTSVSVDRAPQVQAPATVNATEMSPLTFTVTAADPDGQPLTSLTASGLPAGTTFTPNGSFTSGTVAWTPSYTAAPGPYTITFTASNGLSGTATTSVTVANVDRAPVVTVAGSVTVNENQQLSLPVTVSDPDGDAINSLTAGLTGLPTAHGAVFTTNGTKTQGTLTWTPTSNDGRGAPYTVTFSAANALTGAAATSITVFDAITNLCTNPSFETNTTGWTGYGSATVSRVAGGHEGTFALQVRGPNSVALMGANDSPNYVTNTSAGTRYRYSAWVRSVAHTGTVQLRIREYGPSGSQVGATKFSQALTLSTAWQQLTVDHVAATTGGALDLQVLDTPRVVQETFLVDDVTIYLPTSASPPVVTAPASVNATEGVPVTIDVAVTDPDGDAIDSLTTNLSGLPAGHGAVFNVNETRTAATLTWTPSFTSAPGSYVVSFTGRNALSGSTSTLINVSNTDRAPVVTAAPSQAGAENVGMGFTVTATDPDGDALTDLTATGLPPGATFVANGAHTSGTFAWTPGFTAAPGPHVVTFTAVNALTGSATTSITVANVDRAPQVTAAAIVNGAENSAVSFTVTAADLDGDAIATLSASGLPAGATFTPSGDRTSGTFAWTPGYADSGSYAVTFTAANALSGSAATTVRIGNVDRAPVVSAPATRVGASGVALAFTVTAADPDGDAIATLSASGLPAGATFTHNGPNTSGQFSWTPSPGDGPGPFVVTFTAANALSGGAPTSITVDRAPAVTVAATHTVAENAQLTFTVTAADPDGDAIASLSASGLPAGATFTPNGTNTSATFTWTPDFTAAPGPYVVTFTAANALSGSATTSITVTEANRAPVVTAPATRVAAVGVQLAFTVTAADPDGDAITSLDASGLPSGAVFTPSGDHTSGTLTWTPSSGDGPGPFVVTFTAANALSGSASTSITVDRAPVVTAEAGHTVAENVLLTFTVTAADVDGDAIATLSASGLPAGATFTANGTHTSGLFAWTPTNADAGSYDVTFTAANALSGSAATHITVTNVDRAPVVTAPATRTVAVGAPLTFTVTAADLDGDAIASLDASGLPAGATFTSDGAHASGTFTWTPQASDGSGPFVVTFTAANALSGSATTTISIDRAPVVTVAASYTVVENAPLTFTVTAADVDSDAIASLSATGLPAGATFTPNGTHTSGLFSWTPSYTDSGSYVVTFTAANALSGNAATALVVTNVDRAPVVTAPATATVGEMQPLAFTVSASDPDGDPIATLVATGLPAGATFTPSGDHTSGTLAWTPGFDGAGASPYSLFFAASNALTGTAGTVVTVTEADRAPVVTAAPSLSATEGFELSFTVTAADPDGEAITTLSASGLPAGATFVANGARTSGTFTWTPAFTAAPGPYVVTFTAANAQAGSATTSLTVANVDRVPQVTAAAIVNGSENAGVSFTVTAADPDGDAIATLSASGLPAGATFTANGGHTSGTFAWTPGYSDSGSYAVTFTAANAVSGNAITTVRIANVDRAPVVTVAPAATVTEGQQLSLAVTASDPDGDAIAALAAALAVLPAGHNAVFTSAPNHTSGTLTWTPTTSDGRPAPYAVTFTAANALSGNASTAITVQDAFVNLVANPGFEVNLNGWGPNGSSTLTRVADAHSGGFGCQVRGPSTTAAFGINDSPNIVGTTTAGRVYRYTAYVRSVAHVGKTRLRVREYNSASALFQTAYSPIVTLSPTWQLLTVDIAAVSSGNFLDFQVLDTPVTTGEIFLVDDIVIYEVPPGAPSSPSMANTNPLGDDESLNAIDIREFTVRMGPNPTRGDATLELSLTRSGPVRAHLYDVRGRVVRTLIDAPMLEAGMHRIAFAGRDGRNEMLAPGVYFYRVEALEGTQRGRLVVVK